MSLEDFDLFLREMQDVTPIKKPATANIRKTSQETPGQQQRRHAAQQELSDPNFLSLDNPKWVKPHDHLEYKKSGVQEGVFKKLRLAKYDNEARLDLYQFTVKEARAAIFQFINDCIKHELRNVLIIHGRGHNSSPPGKMKSYVNTWLREFDQVLSFHTALREHGGTGAVYVSLRKSEREKLENRERHARRQK